MQRLIEQPAAEGDVLEEGAYRGRVHYHLTVYQHFSDEEGEAVPANLEVEGHVTALSDLDVADLYGRGTELTLRLADGRALDFRVVHEDGTIHSTARGLYSSHPSGVMDVPGKAQNLGQESHTRARTSVHARPVQIRAGAALIDGDLVIPDRAVGLVVFAHGSGSSRFSRRNRTVAETLEDGGFATLLLDLLTREEEAIDVRTREYRFDIDRLGHRVVAAIDWASGEFGVSGLPVGCFGASTGAAAALIAAAERPDNVRAVISRGGRPDLAGDALPRIGAPTLLIVGGADEPVIELNRQAMRRMRAPVALEVIPGATHLFEEPGTLEEVARLALEWCRRHLGRARP
jgi:putative phosphoribosyl transferase